MYKGYVTVWLSLTIGILMSLVLMVIEGVRGQTIRMQTESVADMALNSAFAEYHRQMLEQYDLFFIDTSYGTANPSFQRTEDHIKSFMNLNFRPLAGAEAMLMKNLTGLQAEGVSLLQASVASDERGEVLKQQSIAYMEEKFGILAAERMLKEVGAIGDGDLTDRDIKREWDQVDGRIEVLKEEEKRLRKEEQGMTEEEAEAMEIQNPADQVSAARDGILGVILDNTSGLSRVKTDSVSLASRRTLREGTGLMEGREVKNGIMAKGLFQLYLMEKCGNYNKPKENSFFRYQAEYLLGGKADDLENLKQTVMKIMLLREAANAVYLFADSGKTAQAQAMAIAATSACLLPELAELVKISILFAWSHAESVKDMRMLLDGERVPVVKSADTWNTPLSQLLTFQSHLGEYRKNTTGLEYEDYLNAFLFLENDEQKVYRLMDMMELDIRLTKGNENFRIDACIDGVKAQMLVTSAYGYEYDISRSYYY